MSAGYSSQVPVFGFWQTYHHEETVIHKLNVASPDSVVFANIKFLGVEVTLTAALSEPEGFATVLAVARALPDAEVEYDLSKLLARAACPGKRRSLF